MEIVFDAVEEHPACTAAEIQGHTELTEYQVRRRLTDLKNQGKVRQGEVRTCRVKGTKMVTWSATLPSSQGKLF